MIIIFSDRRFVYMVLTQSVLSGLSPIFSERTARQIYQTLILPHFDYCSSVWGDCNLTLYEKLQKLQNRAVRTITRSNYDTSASFLLNRLNWDDLITRRQKLKATLMFKTINGLTPVYLQNRPFYSFLLSCLAFE